MKKGTSTYTLKCSYYKKQFNTMQELLDDIISSGMDPNYYIYRNGKSIKTKAIMFILPQASKIQQHIFKQIKTHKYEKTRT